MIRAFLAIELPAVLRPVLSRVQEELKKSGADVKWVPVGNIHITLKFFGNITEEQVTDLSEAVTAPGRQPGTLYAHGDGRRRLPHPQKPPGGVAGSGG